MHPIHSTRAGAALLAALLVLGCSVLERLNPLSSGSTPSQVALTTSIDDAEPPMPFVAAALEGKTPASTRRLDGGRGYFTIALQSY